MRKSYHIFSFIMTALLLISPIFCNAQLLNSAWPGFRNDIYHRATSSHAGPQSGATYQRIHIGGSGLSSIVVGNGRAYAFGDGKLYALGVDGSVIWTYQIGIGGWSTPAVDIDGKVYVTSNDGILYAINNDGTLSWQYNFHTTIDASPAIAPDGSIYIGCNNSKFYAFRKGSLTPLVYTAGGAIRSSAAIGTDGSVYFGCDDGKLYALTSTFKAKWTKPFAVTKPIKSSPAIGMDGSIYVGSMDGYLYAIRPTDGGMKWRSLTAGAIFSSPAVSNDGFVYVGCQGSKLYRVNASNGSGKSVLSTRGYIDSSPAIDANGNVYVGSYDGSLYDVNSNDVMVWSADLGAPIASSPTIGENGTLYVLTTAGDICVFGSDTTPPSKPIVIDDGSYSTSINTLHASWQCLDPESGIARYEYAIGTSPSIQDVVAFNDAGQLTEITRNDLTLVSGKDYFVFVRATNGAGLVSETSISDGIRIDTTPPATPIIADDGDYTSIGDTLHIVFSSGDIESGISHYEISVGDAQGISNISSWKNIGQIKDQSITGLSLTNGKTYYVNVRAYNNAGLSNQSCSNGILVDTTAPSISSLDVHSSPEDMRVVVAASDPESGIDKLQYVLLTSPQMPASPAWVGANVGTDIIIPGPFDRNKNYYVAVRASNHAGLWCNPRISNQIHIDDTPPNIPIVTDDGQFQSSTSSLHASWIAADPESGIKNYSYCVGTAPYNASVVKWTNTTQTSISLTGLNLTNGGKYYISVKAINDGGLVSDPASSDGITIDTTLPSVPVVIDDGEQTSIPDSLHAVWSASDAESGIVEFACCVGTSPGSDNIAPWRSTGGATSYIIRDISLYSYQKYFISVKARNGAGEWGGVGSSDGIGYKSGLAIWGKFRNDAQNSGYALVNGSMTGKLGWKVQTQGYVESSAAIDRDGTSYIGSSDGKLYAIANNGKIKWSFQAGDCIDSSPAIGSNGSIYFGSYDKNLYCINSDGTQKWKYTCSGMIWSSPTISSDGVIYFGCQNGYLYALNPDGTLKWKYNAGSSVWSSPSLDAQGNIYFGCGDGTIRTISADGTLKWAYQTGSAVDSSPALDANGVIYAGSGDGYVYAINPNGTLRWRYFMGDIADASPAVTKDGRVYFGIGVVGPKGALCAFNTDGTLLWRLNLPGGVRSSPAVDANGTIYVGCTDSKIYAVSPAGQKLWLYATKESLLGSPAIGGDGSVVIGSDDGCVYSFKDITIVDSTPPSQPIVTVNKKFITLGSAISAVWTSSDIESGIQSYSYAIGTTPGTDDIVAWTLTGLVASMTRSDLDLKIGKSYYVSVKSINYAEQPSNIGVSEPITVVSDDQSNTIGMTKKKPFNTQVHLLAKIITAVFADCVFVEEPNRASAIRCAISGCSLPVGAVVDITGILQQVNGETIIGSAVLQQTGTANPIMPINICGDALYSIGLDVTGLLMRITGKVTRSDKDYIIINDGCNAYSPRGYMGIEVRVNLTDLPSVGSYVGVAGIPCIEVVNSRVTKIIRAANDPQFTVYLVKN